MGYLLAAFLLWTLLGLILIIRSLGSAIVTASLGEIASLIFLWPIHLRFFYVLYRFRKDMDQVKNVLENIE
ncbi:hypothetical protein LCGC14_2132380 [marine sediment metagenome]|uniref:DUF4282 domain-containing protein n=1 Tax=marine sediment metagenome TaxID=412755 RepID=A0A0F9GX09_9ZZZZ